jgi:hypothetical protein
MLSIKSIANYVQILLLVLSTTACRIQVDVPINGYVTTADGSFECLQERQCMVDVSTADFSQEFVAVPHDGFEFIGWKKVHRGFCGNSVENCQLETTGFEEFDLLMALLDSDAKFFLSPSFRRLGDPDLTDLTGTWLVDFDVTYAYSTSRGEGVATISKQFSLGIYDNRKGRLELTYCPQGGLSQHWQEIENNRFSLDIHGAYIQFEIDSKGRLIGKVLHSEFYDYQKAEITARRRTMDVVGQPGFSLGRSTVSITVGDEVANHNSPIFCFSHGEKTGVFAGNPFASTSLDYFASTTSNSLGEMHNASLKKYDSVDDANLTYQSTARSIPMLVHGDGNGGDKISFRKNAAGLLRGEFSAADEDDSTSFMSGTFSLSY